MKKFLGILVVLFVLGTVSVAAADYYVDVTNNTGYTIYYLYVSPEYSSEWEEDVLDDDVIMDGETVRVWLYNYDTSIFDIQAVDEDGDTYTFFGIDVEFEDLVINLSDID